MVAISEIVGNTRSLLSAGLGNDVTRLSSAYNPLDPTIKIMHDKRVNDGAAISIGLTTLIAATSSSGREIAVVPGIDGSPDQSAPSGELVHLRPRHTTWQVFREVVATVDEVSSPVHGLYALVDEEFPSDTVDQTYVLSAPAIRILRVRYKRPGSQDEWHDVAWDFQPRAPLGPTVRARSHVPGGTTVHIQQAVPFLTPERLGENLADLHIPESYARLLAVGAARNLALATESRRAQPFAQGDPRRAEEVQMGSSAMVFDRLERMFKRLVADERARLVAQHPYRSQMERLYA